jgi:hypothetical protein
MTLPRVRVARTGREPATDDVGTKMVRAPLGMIAAEIRT